MKVELCKVNLLLNRWCHVRKKQSQHHQISGEGKSDGEPPPARGREGPGCPGVSLRSDTLSADPPEGRQHQAMLQRWRASYRCTTAYCFTSKMAFRHLSKHSAPPSSSRCTIITLEQSIAAIINDWSDSETSVCWSLISWYTASEQSPKPKPVHCLLLTWFFVFLFLNPVIQLANQCRQAERTFYCPAA